jgi:hypothetical protein
MWSVSGGIQDEGKTVDIPQQLTVTIFFIIVMQLLELQIPMFRERLILDIELEINLVKLPFSLRIHSASFEDGTLRVDPIAQFQAPLWHFTCNARRETNAVLVEVFKMKVKRSTAQNNSQ